MTRRSTLGCVGLILLPLTWPFQPFAVTEHRVGCAAERAAAPTGTTAMSASRHVRSSRRERGTLSTVGLLSRPLHRAHRETSAVSRSRRRVAARARSCASTVLGSFAPESPGSLQASEIQCVRGDAEHDEHDRRSPRLNVRQAESGRGQTDHRQDPDERSHPALLEHLTDYAMIVRVAQSAGFRHNLGTFAGWWGW